jgi:Xaa-Pro dipeptidase
MSGNRGFLDRRRAERLMREQELDALVLAQPESIRYATGAFAGVASFWRRAGAAFVVVPRDAGQQLTAIVGDLQAAEFQTQSGITDVRTHELWVETSAIPDNPGDDIAAALVTNDIARGRIPGRPRPTAFSPRASLELLRDALGERGMLRSRIGLELGFVPAADFPMFAELMPQSAFVDCSPLVARLRAIKQPREIEMLRDAAELSMTGIQALLPTIRPGLDAAAMTAIWREATREEAKRRAMAPPDSDWASPWPKCPRR